MSDRDQPACDHFRQGVARQAARVPGTPTLRRPIEDALNANDVLAGEKRVQAAGVTRDRLTPKASVDDGIPNGFAAEQHDWPGGKLH
jgi:hypothetical protein